MHYLEERLHQWADWYLSGNSYGLGYPRCSIEYRILLEGCIQHNPGPKPLPTNEAAEEIEALVKQMAEYNENMAKALRCHYFLTGTLRTKSAKLKISHSHFKHYVDMGHQWLAGRLFAKRDPII
ncbi:MAG TPA: antiterminator Q family protein [Gammaproteobacteria bacterium]|nr:antiterminator Q family protein [Gammaproteobacteria bacterium]